MKPFILFLSLIFSFQLNAQITFSDNSGLLNVGGGPFNIFTKKVRYQSKNPIAITDMDYDNMDDIVIFHREDCDDRSMVILYQRANSGGWPFLRRKRYLHTKPFPSVGEVIGVTISDTKNNNELQVFTGGKHFELKLYNPFQPTASPVPISPSSFHTMFWLQGCNFVDIDGDNDLDLFACNDDHKPEVFYNNQGIFQVNFSQLNPIAPNQICTHANSNQPSNFFDPNSGNYGSVFADIDFDETNLGNNSPELYISKCRGGVIANAPMGCLTNQLFKKINTAYVDQAATYGLDDSNQSWAADFGDIDNDGDLDAVLINHSGPQNIRLFQNQYPSPTFVDITSSAFVNNIPTSNSYQVIFEDFDNDGYLDILVSNKSGSHLYRNNGNSSNITYTDQNNWLNSNNNTHNNYEAFFSCATGDLDNDGYVDIYASYFEQSSTPKNDIIWINQGFGYDYIKVRLQGSTSNNEAIGARLHLEHPTLGTQVREVRAGESYGIVCSFIQHFGIANHNIQDFTLKIFWPSGNDDTIPGTNLTKNSVNVFSE